MKSHAKTVDEYMETVPVERLEVLQKIRQLCLEHLKGYEELIAYGGPVYQRNGTIEVGFASQKNFIGLYILKQEALIPHKHLLKGISVGKGVIRYANLKKINFDVIKMILEATCNSDSSICGPVIQ